MNLDQVEGGLRQVTGRVKEHWGNITGDLSVAAAGRRDQLAGKVQQRRALSKQRAARQLRDFMQRNRNWYLLSR